MLQPLPSSTLFPYTTLFRSHASYIAVSAMASVREMIVGRAPTRSTSRAVDDHLDRKSTRLNSSHVEISYAVFCLKKKRGPASSVSRRSTAGQITQTSPRHDAFSGRSICFNAAASPELYTLSLHDALPISRVVHRSERNGQRARNDRRPRPHPIHLPGG